MAELSIDTDLTRELAAEFRRASATGDELAAEILRTLGVAELTSSAPADTRFLSEDLDRAGVVIAQQADLADGLEIDIDTFAEAMDVDPDELAEQLELIEDQVNGLDAGILPLLFWDPDLGQPQSLRQVFVDLPAAGEDPALDLLLQELDAWLLPMLLDGSLADADLTAAQAAQLAEFGLLIGSDQATVIRSEREQYRDNGETEYRTVEVTYTVAELGGEALQDFVAQAFAEDLALQRLPSVPSFGQLVGILARLTKEEIDRLFSELRYVGDERDDRMVEAFRRNNPGLDVEAILAEFGELTWLPAVLAGRALPPTDPASQELLIGFVQAVGLVPRAVTFDQALKILRGERILQGEVVLGNPTGGIILFDDVALDGIDDVATRAGILTDGDVDAVNAFAEALLASGTGEFDRFATLSDAELGGEPLEFSQEIFIQLLASTVDLDLLTENQLIAALVYIDGATTAGDQARRIANAVIGFQTTAAIGPPTLTEGQYRQVLGNDTWNYLNSRARSERGRRYKDGDDWLTDHSNSKTNLELQNEQTRFIFEHIGVPGYHKKKFRRRRLHLAVDGNGDTAAFVVEKIPKKSWVGTAFTLVFAIGAAFSGNVYASYALAATQFARAALDGDWLGAFAAAASTILLVDGLGQVAGNLGVSTAIAGSSVAGFQTAIEVAKTVSIGIGLATSIADNDTVGIIVNSTRALASGAEVFDYADTADNLATVATLIESVDTAVEAIENDDILLAAAASAGAVAAGAKLGSSSNLFGPETTELLEDVSETFDATGRTIGGVDRTIDAIEDDDIVGAAVGILQTGSAATDLASDGLVGDRVFGLGEDGVAFGDKVAEALDTAATTTQTVDVAVQAFEDGDISAGITAVGQAIAAGASVFQAGGLGADLLGLDEDAILAVEAIITTAEDVAAGAEVASAIERDDVFAAIEILTARIAENQGPDDSLVGHYADQLSKLTALAETLTRIDDLDQTAFFEALIPDLNALGTALESRDEPLPLFADTAQFQAVDALIDTIDQALFPPEPAPAPIFVANPDIGPDQQVILAASTNENGEIVVTELPAFPITTVEPGQTLTEIARYYGVDVDELIALNPQLEDPDLIQPGDPLRLPDDATPTFHPSPARPAIDPTTGEPIGPLVVVTAEELAAVLGTTANLLLAQDPTLADPSLDAIDRVSPTPLVVVGPDGSVQLLGQINDGIGAGLALQEAAIELLTGTGLGPAGTIVGSQLELAEVTAAALESGEIGRDVAIEAAGGGASVGTAFLIGLAGGGPLGSLIAGGSAYIAENVAEDGVAQLTYAPIEQRQLTADGEELVFLNTGGDRAQPYGLPAAAVAELHPDGNRYKVSIQAGSGTVYDIGRDDMDAILAGDRETIDRVFADEPTTGGRVTAAMAAAEILYDAELIDDRPQLDEILSDGERRRAARHGLFRLP